MSAWVRWTPARATEEPALAGAVERFRPLDVPAGRAAAAFLRRDALANDGSTRTYLSIVDGEVAGFVSLCAGTVALTRDDADRIDAPHRKHLPACLLAWVARSREGGVSGLELVQTAYGLALEAAEVIGMVAFVLDPQNDAVARVWRAPPYGFEETRTPPRLWIPLGRD